MIIGEKFVWGHLFKTGGDAFWMMANTVPDLFDIRDQINDPAKHDTFKQRKITNRNLALNIRRLPSWFISSFVHAKRYGFYGTQDFLINQKYFFEITSNYTISNKNTNLGAVLCDLSIPDIYLNWFLEGVEVNNWLRMENLRLDFIEFISQFRKLSVEEVHQIKTIKTKPPENYDHDIKNWFTLNQIKTLYNNNPRWAEIESKVYGSLYGELFL